MMNYYVVQIKGKKPKRLLMKIFKLGIDVFDIKYKKEEIVFKTSYSNYEKIKSIKTIYEVSVIDICGINKIKIILKKYRMFFLFFLFGIFLIIFMTRFIFFINYETENSVMKELLMKELESHGITLYSYGKSFESLDEISKIIKEENKDKIEWIQFEKKGVLLNVKVIERKSQESKELDNSVTDIVASKNGYIKDIYVSSGEIVKNKEDYVKKGDIIVSGNIHRNDNVVARVKSSATVYAEVWYIIKANMNINTTINTKFNEGSSKVIINVFNKDLTLFKINKKINVEKRKTLFKTSLFNLVIENKKNYVEKKVKYKDEEVIEILYKDVISKMNSTLSKDEYIMYEKVLKNYKENGKMFIEVFIKTYEDISKEQLSVIEEEEKKDN